MEFIILRTRPILIFSLNTIERIHFSIQNRSQISSINLFKNVTERNNSYNEEKSNK